METGFGQNLSCITLLFGSFIVSERNLLMFLGGTSGLVSATVLLRFETCITCWDPEGLSIYLFVCLFIYWLHGGWSQSCTLARQELLLEPHFWSFWLDCYWDRVSLFSQACLDLCLSIYTFCPYWGSRLCATMLIYWSRWSLAKFLPSLASNCDHPDLGLPSS
jgi:hypothetical protein